jgi:hypothetical protein
MWKILVDRGQIGGEDTIQQINNPCFCLHETSLPQQCRPSDGAYNRTWSAPQHVSPEESEKKIGGRYVENRTGVNGRKLASEVLLQSQARLRAVRLPEQCRGALQGRFASRQGCQGFNIPEASAADALLLQTERPRKGVRGADTRQPELANLGLADALAEANIHGSAPDRVTIMIFIINDGVNGQCSSNIFFGRVPEPCG